MISRRKPPSVRMRLTLWYVGALSVALLGYACLVYVLLWRMMSSELDRLLEQDIQLTEKMLEVEDGRVAWDADLPDDVKKPLVEVRSTDDKVLFRSPKHHKISKPGYRFRTRRGSIKDLPSVTIRAARPTAPMKRELFIIALVLALGIPLATALAGAGGYALARRALAPVDRMAARAKAVTADRLSERLPVENPEDELGRLAMVFNKTFARLERSFEQLRRFTADASHELRTPLTAIRSVGEVGLREPRSGEEYREIIGSMLEESDRLARLVDSLLTLSRADGDQVRLRREPTNLSALAGDVVQQLGALAEEKKQTLRLEAPDTVSVNIDPVVLRQALVNLVDNAIKYSPEESRIQIVVAEKHGRAALEVIDNGPGIALEHRQRIFERFYRVDKARSRQMGGIGLGLAIARWAVEIHGGRIEVENAADRGSLFRITLPL